MARDDQSWNTERSSRFGGDHDRDRDQRSRDWGGQDRSRDRDMREREMRDRDMRDRDMRQGFTRPSEWGDPHDDYGNRSGGMRGESGGSGWMGGRTGGAWGQGGGEAEGGWDEGQPGGRSYGQGRYDQHPESSGQQGYGGGREGSQQQGWGSYSRESNHGSDLGRARNPYGNTGDDNYGGGGTGAYGASSGFSGGGGNQGSWGQGQQGHELSWQQSAAANTQNHVGRGPKGWKRSDDRIREDVNEQLERHPQIDASDIEVRVEDGEVILSGHVSDRRTKRMAEDVVENTAGVREVQNQIRVKREGGVLSQLFGGGGDRDREQERGSQQDQQQRSGTAASQADGQTTSGAAGTATAGSTTGTTSAGTKGNR